MESKKAQEIIHPQRSEGKKDENVRVHNEKGRKHFSQENVKNKTPEK